MAAALLGKCIGLLALILLLYSCCYAFRIREHGVQTSSTSAEQPQRGTCASIFGRCQEKTGTTTTTGRKWHETTASRLASGRKPPAEVTSPDDDDSGAEGVRARQERIGRSREHEDQDVDDAASVEVEDDDDDEDLAIVEVEEEEEEDVDRGVSDEEIEEDSGVDKDDEEKEEEENDDEDDEKEEREKDRRVQRISVEDEDERRSEKDSRKKLGDARLMSKKDVPRGKVIMIGKGVRRSADEAEGQGKADVKKPASLEKERVRDITKREKAEEDDDKVEDVDEDTEDDEDQEDEEDEDDDEDEDEEDDEDSEEEEVESTPPPKKLEKVRFADKDKVKSAEVKPTPAVFEKPIVEVKKPPETTKKQEEPAKKVVEAVRKPVESAKKSAESPGRSAESAKKAELVKPTKPEPESVKPARKSEEKASASVKPELSKVAPKAKPEPPKQPENMKVKTVQVTPAKEVKRFNKEEESKAKPKAHVEAPLTLAQLNDALLRVPTFVPNFTAVEDFECQQHGKIFLRQLRGYKLWALQMLDSSAKIPSSLLRGNVNQLGDFDECLGVVAYVKLNDNTIKVQGKYCLANIDLHASHTNMRLPVNMMQARAFIRGNMHDPGHFIPKFTTANWALCLPAACSAEDAQNILEQALSYFNSTTGIKFTVEVDPNMCYVKQTSKTYSKETIGVLYFYAMIVCLVIVATVRDYLVVSDRKGNYSERIIMSFSLRRTMKSLLRSGTSENDIRCIHGIRTVVTIALYLAHQLIAISRLPFSNRIDLTEVANNPISSVLRASMVYTDAFLLLSGVLTAYNMANEYTIRGEIRWFCRFIARYIRLTPALLAVVFWYAFVMEHTGSGPQWNSVILPNAELCKNNAWTNLLYIQNFFPFEEMCATHTHQLALDMQLSLLTPMLVFFLECKPVIGIIMVFFFILLSATLRYVATMSNYLSLVIFHGMSVFLGKEHYMVNINTKITAGAIFPMLTLQDILQKALSVIFRLKHLYKTANLTYALPLHRATPYVFGVGLGALLHSTGKNVRIHKVLVILGWLIAMALGSWSLFSPWHLARRDYVYDAEEATNYAVISPVLWALSMCWCIFACYTNNGGIINRFLSNHWLVIFSRISYAVYLTQFAVFFYNVGTTRYSTEFQLHRAIDPLEAAAVIAASIVLTLLFDLPMQEIKNVIMESTDMSVVEVANKESPETPVTDDAQKPATGDQVKEKVFEDDDEVALTGWDWQKDIGGTTLSNENVDDEEQVNMPILKKSSDRRRSFIGHDASGEPLPTWDWIKEPSKRQSIADDDYRERGRRGRNDYRDYRDEEDESFDLSRAQQEREEPAKRGRRSLSRSLDSKRLPVRDSDEEDEYLRRREEEEDQRRYRRSESRGRSVIRESDDYRSWEFVGKERSSSRGPDAKRLSSKSDEYEAAQRQTRLTPSRSSDARRPLSSESEDEPSRKKIERRQPSEPRISDEEDWEGELRIRRKQFMEKLATQQGDPLAEEDDYSSPRRRSSAEGKIALLKDPSADDNMDSWTISVGSRVAQLGSSQERSEPEEDNAYLRRREYREQAPPLREDTQSEEEVIWDASRRRSYTSSSQVTSVEEDEDASSFNFVLTKGSKRVSLQDLSKLSQEDSDLADSGWNVVRSESSDALPRSTSLGLFKRESIVKSQASEEDPEYLLPERPKLVQQEREHPFKKAWQMQKSRSEEDGSAAYAIKESKEQTKAEGKPRDDDVRDEQREDGGDQYDDVASFADDESESITYSRSTDTEEYRTASKSEETETASTERSESASIEDNKANSKSDAEEDSLTFNWPTEDQQFKVYKTNLRSKSEETDWNWEEEET